MSGHSKYPVQFQGDNNDADDSHATCMCHVFDVNSEIAMQRIMSREYLHVIAWDADGKVLFTYDNR